MQIAYPIVTIIAIVETLVALNFTALASFSLLTKYSYYYKSSIAWLQSSSFSILWSLADFVLNPFAFILVADEFSAISFAKNGKLGMLPPNTLF